ncbi:MAG TPA: Wadjet anti-phage system protein JetD domain-containing protein [Chitinophagaceae bacterium]|nr:Wadjet anti-phage system protein JetD domain-containing protein [Chitinophagaceae bacterium]
MITPQQILQQVNKWWIPLLQSHLGGSPFFPRTIDRIGRIRSGKIMENFQVIQEEVRALYVNSKSEIGYGYQVNTSLNKFKRLGTHELPTQINFETVEDYVLFTGKKREWERFKTDSDLISRELPLLKAWMHQFPEMVISNHNKWNGLLKVCQYFLKTPKPQMYLRQLPIEVHTKFIEENETVLHSLLDFILGDSNIRDRSEKNISKRYFLLYDEPVIRTRILDDSMKLHGIADFSIRISDFYLHEPPCSNIIVAENKMNFLSIPSLPGAMAIWSGGGFNISYLKDAHWLKNKKIFYWGDLDIQGFQILHQMRTYFPQTQSVMMDKMTLFRFKADCVPGVKNFILSLDSLTEEEINLYLDLKENNLRLEQERIPQDYAEKALRKIISMEHVGGETS